MHSHDFKEVCKSKQPLLNDYDPRRPSNYLMYLGANNLYGWAMCQTTKENETLDINAILHAGDTGYVLRSI